MHDAGMAASTGVGEYDRKTARPWVAEHECCPTNVCRSGGVKASKRKLSKNKGCLRIISPCCPALSPSPTRCMYEMDRLEACEVGAAGGKRQLEFVAPFSRGLPQGQTQTYI